MLIYQVTAPSNTNGAWFCKDSRGRVELIKISKYTLSQPQIGELWYTHWLEETSLQRYFAYRADVEPKTWILVETTSTDIPLSDVVSSHLYKNQRTGELFIHAKHGCLVSFNKGEVFTGDDDTLFTLVRHCETSEEIEAYIQNMRIQESKHF